MRQSGVGPTLPRPSTTAAVRGLVEATRREPNRIITRLFGLDSNRKSKGTCPKAPSRGHSDSLLLASGFWLLLLHTSTSTIPITTNPTLNPIHNPGAPILATGCWLLATLLKQSHQPKGSPITQYPV